MKPCAFRRMIQWAVVLTAVSALLLVSACGSNDASMVSKPSAPPAASPTAKPSPSPAATMKMFKPFANDFTGEAPAGEGTYVAVNIVLDGDTKVKSAEVYFIKRNQDGKITELQICRSDGASITDGDFQCPFTYGSGMMKGKLAGDVITCQIILSNNEGFMKAGTYQLGAHSGPLSFYAVQVIWTPAPMKPVEPWVPGIK